MANNNELKYKIEVDASQATKNLKKFQSDLKSAFDDKGIKPGLNKMNKEMTSSLNKMSKEVSEMSKSINKEINNSTKGLSSSLNTQLKKMSKLSSTAKATGKQLGQALLKGMQSALTNLASLGKVLFRAFSGMATTFLSIGKSFGIAISSGIRMCTGIMRSSGIVLATAISTGLKAGYSVIKFAARGLVSTINTALNGAYTVASNVAGKISGVISKAINQEGRINLKADVGNYSSGAYNALSGNNIMNSMNTMLSAMKATMPKQIGSVFESVTVGVANSFSKLTNAVLLASQAFTAFKQFKPQIMSGLSSLIGTIKPYIQSTMNLVGSYIKLQMGTTFAPVTAVFNELISKCRAAGSAMVEGAKEFIASNSGITSILSNIGNNLTTAIALIKQSLTNHSKSFGTAIVNMVNKLPALTNGLENVKNGIKKALLGLVDAVKPWVEALGSIIRNVVSILQPLWPTFKALCNAILAVVKEVGIFVRDLIRCTDGLVPAGKKLVSAIDQIGRSLVQGLKLDIMAIIDTFDLLINGLRKAVSKIGKIFGFGGKEKEHNYEPYKRTKQVWNDDDYAWGFNNERPDTNSALDELEKNLKETENELKKAADSTEKFSNSVKDFNVNVNINDDSRPYSKNQSFGREETHTDTNTAEEEIVQYTNMWGGLKNTALNSLNSIINKLNDIKTDIPEGEVKQLTDEFEKAKTEFQGLFNIKGTGSLGKNVSDIMEKISKYSTMLAKIKNPLLTIRTEKAKKSLSDLTESAKKTKAVYDNFKKANENLKAVRMDKNASGMDKFRASIEKAKAAFNLLKSSMSTTAKFKGFESATKSLANAQKDMEKLKAKVKSIFKSMFDNAKNSAKSGWNKLKSVFQKGASDCEKPVSRLGGIVKKLASMFGLTCIAQLKLI